MSLESGSPRKFLSIGAKIAAQALTAQRIRQERLFMVAETSSEELHKPRTGGAGEGADELTLESAPVVKEALLN